jgi:hypothetical protein
MTGVLQRDKARRYRESARDVFDDEARAEILKLAAEIDQQARSPTMAAPAP